MDLQVSRRFHGIRNGQKQRLWLLAARWAIPWSGAAATNEKSWKIDIENSLEKKTPCNPYYNEKYKKKHVINSHYSVQTRHAIFSWNRLSRVSTFAGLVWWACCACNSCGCLDFIVSRGCCTCFMYLACSMQLMACIRPCQVLPCAWHYHTRSITTQWCFFLVLRKTNHAVDGWNPKQPPGMYRTL